MDIDVVEVDEEVVGLVLVGSVVCMAVIVLASSVVDVEKESDRSAIR